MSQKSASLNTRELRRQAKRRIEGLSAERLWVANDFLAYLEERESEQATAELLNLPRFREQFEQAKQEQATKHAVNWRKIRDDV